MSIEGLLQKWKIRTEPVHNEEEQQLLSEIAKTQQEISSIYKNFNTVTEQSLLDYYSYQLKACQAKHAYLIRCAREMGLKKSI